jgi:predicted ATP-grasp superfamily ATP-dependent carboligase
MGVGDKMSCKNELRELINKEIKNGLTTQELLEIYYAELQDNYNCTDGEKVASAMLLIKDTFKNAITKEELEEIREEQKDVIQKTRRSYIICKDKVKDFIKDSKDNIISKEFLEACNESSKFIKKGEIK